MRLSEIRCAHHIGLQFKAHWMINRRRKVDVTAAESILSAKGVEIVDPNQLLRPAVVEEPFNPPVSPTIIPDEKPPCYIFKNSFQPVAGLEQCQLLTNSLVFDELPDTILSQMQDPTSEDEQVIKECALHSLVLDAKQDRLPHILDVHNHPGYHPRRQFGIPKGRKISSLVHKLLLHLNQTHKSTVPCFLIEDVASGVTLEHLGKLMHMNHEAKLMVCSRQPLDPVLSPAQVREFRDSTMPDIFPLSPFIHCRSHTYYDIKESFAVPGTSLAPRTIVVSHEHYLSRCEGPPFYGLSLLHAFSHAAAFARHQNKDANGDLANPVTLNVVHTDGQHIHMGRFQLNTLDLSSATRNLFWSAPWEPFYQHIGFDSAKPSIQEVNARPLAILKAMF